MNRITLTALGALVISMILQVSQAAPSLLDTDRRYYGIGIERIEAKHKKDVDVILEKYGKYMDSLMKKSLSKGDIKKHDELNAEKDKFIAERALPPEYQNLFQVPDKSRDLAVSKLTKQYAVTLKYHKIKLAKAGNLEAARVVDAEIDAMLKLAALKSDEALKPVKAVKVVKSFKNRAMEKTLGYSLSDLIRIRDHKDAKKCDATGNYYKFFAGKITWEEAHKKCELMGGHLATVSSEEELTFIMKMTDIPKGKKGKKGKKRKVAFIGLTDMKQSGDWKWVTGEPMVKKNSLDIKSSNFKGEFYGCLSHAGIADIMNGWKGIQGFICEWED